MGFAQYPASGSLEIDFANVTVSEHDVERGQICPQELLKVRGRFVAPLLQLLLHSRLLRGGRKIRSAVELAEQIIDLLQQHRRPAAIVLATAGEPQLQQSSFDAGELLAEVVGGFSERFGVVV